MTISQLFLLDELRFIAFGNTGTRYLGWIPEGDRLHLLLPYDLAERERVVSSGQTAQREEERLALVRLRELEHAGLAEHHRPAVFDAGPEAGDLVLPRD